MYACQVDIDEVKSNETFLISPLKSEFNVEHFLSPPPSNQTLVLDSFTYVDS